MRTLLGLFLALTFGAQAATVTNYITDGSGRPVVGTILFRPITVPSVVGTSNILGATVSANCPRGAWSKSLVTGFWLVDEGFGNRLFYIGPNDNGTNSLSYYEMLALTTMGPNTFTNLPANIFSEWQVVNLTNDLGNLNSAVGRGILTNMPAHLASMDLLYDNVTFIGDSRMGHWPGIFMTNSFISKRFTSYTNLAANGYHATAYTGGVATITVSSGVASVALAGNGHYLTALSRVSIISAQTPALNGYYTVTTVADNNHLTFATTLPDGTSCTDAQVRTGCEATTIYCPPIPAGHSALAIVNPGINDLGIIYQTGGAATNAGFILWTTGYTNIVYALQQKGYTVITMTVPPTWSISTLTPGGVVEPCFKMMNSWIINNQFHADRVVDLASLLPNPANSIFWNGDLLHWVPEGDLRVASLVNSVMIQDSYASISDRPYTYSPIGQEPSVKWFQTNDVAYWPTVALAAGASVLVMSNTDLYLLKSSIGSTAWSATNYIGGISQSMLPNPLFTNTAASAYIYSNATAATSLRWIPGTGLVSSNASSSAFSLLSDTNGGLNLGGLLPAGAGSIIASNTITAANGVRLLGTTNFIVFGTSNLPPASAVSPSKWVSVQINGEATIYRMPLYQ